jgi:hypothetical protein
MAVLVIGEVPGGTAERDAAAVAALGLEGNPPAGARFRIAGPTANGWRVLSLWDSQEQFDQFLEQRLEPTLEQLGIATPSFDFWPIESVIIR